MWKVRPVRSRRHIASRLLLLFVEARWRRDLTVAATVHSVRDLYVWYVGEASRCGIDRTASQIQYDVCRVSVFFVA
jgi:hypothetical protein